MPEMSAANFKEWMVDNKGRCVVTPTEFWSELLNRNLSDDNKFVPIQLFETNENAENGTYLIHRPSGGFGDIICLLPGLTQFLYKLKTNNAKFIVIAIPKHYHWLVKPLKGIVDFVLEDYREFHKEGFNTTRARFRNQYFLWCPAGKHEFFTKYRPFEGRTDNFGKLFISDFKLGRSVIELDKMPVKSQIKCFFKWLRSTHAYV